MSFNKQDFERGIGVYQVTGGGGWRWVRLASLAVVLVGTAWVAAAADEVTSPPAYRLDRKLLDESLRAGKSYLLFNQTLKGNFIYGYNIKTKDFSLEDNQVRQAGALWGVALIHRDQPMLLTQKALTAGLSFFALNSKQVTNVGRYTVYGKDKYGLAGTVALVTLTHVELLAESSLLSEEEESIFNRYLDQYLMFVEHMRRDDGRFASYYKYQNGAPFGKPSCYYDGECVLALTKAADLRGDDRLAGLAVASAEAMYKAYVEKPVTEGIDDAQAKGFFQWGCMTFRGLYLSGWPGSEVFAKRAVDYALWMIDVHKVLERRRNTAYAYEGIICAYDLAKRLGDKKSADRLAAVVDEGLWRLTTWQVGGPLENDYLSKLKVRDPIAVGGVLNAADEPALRIDVTQHQMHAVLLARQLLYAQP